MLELATISTIAKLVTSLWSVIDAHSDGKLDAKDLKGWSDFLDNYRSLNQVLNVPEEAPSTLAKSVALLAFNLALRDHWSGSDDLAPRARFRFRSLFGKPTPRESQLQCAVNEAVDQLREVDIASDSNLFGSDPAASVTYGKLWSTFTTDNEAVARAVMRMKGQEPPAELVPLILEPARAKTSFERSFRFHLRHLFAANPTQFEPLTKQLLESGGIKTIATILAVVSVWDARPILGFDVDGEGEPLLVGDMYVEPAIQGTGAPILAYLNSWLDDRPSVQVILGDFGLGKSLSARMFAVDLARRALEAETPSSHEWVPIYVPCRAVLEQRAFDLGYVIRRSVQLLWSESGRAISIDDPALTIDANQRMVVILDGLDEKVLSHSELESLLRSLGELTGDNRRFLVLSRPALIDSVKLDARYRVENLAPFDLPVESVEGTSRVEKWLTLWNQHKRSGKTPITIERLQSRGILDEAATPIVLFVIAFGWPEDGPSDSDAEDSRSRLYERFLKSVARGKLIGSGERHEAIEEAATHLQNHLVEHDFMKRDSSKEDALLWALSALAWQAHCADQTTSPTFTRRDVELFFAKELRGRDLEETVCDLILDGVLLALQHGASRQSARIMYGHKSFREFLVARFWSVQLASIAANGESSIWDSLRGGLLDIYQDASKTFLIDLLRDWTTVQRNTLAHCLQRQFEDETIVGESGQPSLISDRRIEVRHSAMVVYALVREVEKKLGNGIPGVSVKRARLLSLYAGLLIKHSVVHPRWWLQGSRWSDVDLEGLVGGGYWFLEDAKVENCFISQRMWDSWFRNCEFTHSRFVNAKIYRGDFPDVVFNECTFINTTFTDCTFPRTVFRGVPSASRLEFVRCAFGLTVAGGRPSIPLIRPGPRPPSRLKWQTPFGLVFEECTFESLNFSGSKLVQVEFLKCDLKGADFSRSDLRDATFRECELDGAQFVGASDKRMRFRKCTGAFIGVDGVKRSFL